MFFVRLLKRLRELDFRVEHTIFDNLGGLDCLYKLEGGDCTMAVYLLCKGIDVSLKELKGYTVRAWMGDHLYLKESARMT